MGEIAVSLFIGGWMISVGIFMLIYLNKEEKKYREEENNKEKSYKTVGD